MPLQVQVYRIFVSSPSDVQAERDALEDVVRKLNATVGEASNTRLELIKWETAAYPALGSDPQAVINEQLPSDYDIFLGILWQRFGTPTPRAASGTLEEFENAYRRYLDDPGSVEVMFYFKKAQVDPHEVDLEQLSQVRSFRERLDQEGIIGNFADLEQFKSHVELHLHRLLSAKGPSARVSQPRDRGEGTEAFAEEAAIDESDEEGFLDLIERAEESMAAATAAAGQLSSHIELLGGSATDAGEELAELGKIDTPEKRRLAKRAVNQMAERMIHFGASVEAEIPKLGESFGRSIRSLQDAAALASDFEGDPSEQVRSVLQNVQSLRETVSYTAESMLRLRQSISTQPRLTTQFNRARRRAVEAMDHLGRELSGEQEMLREAELLLENLLKDE